MEIRRLFGMFVSRVASDPVPDKPFTVNGQKEILLGSSGAIFWQ
jgi:hypothetical protein